MNGQVSLWLATVCIWARLLGDGLEDGDESNLHRTTKKYDHASCLDPVLAKGFGWKTVTE